MQTWPPHAKLEEVLDAEVAELAREHVEADAAAEAVATEKRQRRNVTAGK